MEPMRRSSSRFRRSSSTSNSWLICRPRISGMVYASSAILLNWSPSGVKPLLASDQLALDLTVLRSPSDPHALGAVVKLHPQNVERTLGGQVVEANVNGGPLELRKLRG